MGQGEAGRPPDLSSGSPSVQPSTQTAGRHFALGEELGSLLSPPATASFVCPGGEKTRTEERGGRNTGCWEEGRPLSTRPWLRPRLRPGSDPAQGQTSQVHLAPHVGQPIADLCPTHGPGGPGSELAPDPRESSCSHVTRQRTDGGKGASVHVGPKALPRAAGREQERRNLQDGRGSTGAQRDQCTLRTGRA